MAEHYTIHPLKRFIDLLKPEKDLVFTIYIYAIFAGLVSLTLPLGIQAIINLITGGRVSTSWILLVIMVIMGIIVTGFLQVKQLSVNEVLQQRIFGRASFEFAYKIPRFKIQDIRNLYLPELINRFFDTISVQKGLSKILIDFTTASFQIIFGLLLLSFYHPFFIVFSLLLVLLVFAIIRLTVERGLRTSLRESHYKYETAHWLEEIARNVETFKMAGDSELPLQRNDVNTEEYIKARRDHFRVIILQFSMMIAFKALVAAGLLLIGGILVFDQQMNIGQFVAAEIIIILIVGSVEKIISSVESVFDVLTSITKIGMVTDIPIEENLSGDKEVSFEHGIHIKLTDVTLQEDNYVFLNGMNLEINNEEKICIVGNANAGKTILLQLLAGWYDHYDGNIQFNNVSLKDLNLTRLRRQIGDCMSTEGIFQGTMEENIMVGYPGANFTDLQAATNHSGLSEFMFGMSGGFTKMLYPEDKTLPKSVKQQVLWARGIIGPKSLILWEDIYGMVSFQEKMNLIAYLTSERNKQTVILVSNDMHIISKCTRIIGMEKGTILYDISPAEIDKHDWFNEICINKNA